MASSSIRVVVVDDYQRWRHLLSTTLLKQPNFSIVVEVSDGLEAVRKAGELQPDLILLDIGLPTLNGIEAARRIREVSSTSKIIFVSENRSVDIAEAALSTGAEGYVVKSDVASELLTAVDAVLQGKRFVSVSMAGHDLASSEYRADNHCYREKVTEPFPTQKEIRHEVEFYADDAGFVDGFARFIEAALKSGNAVIVVATESHHANLSRRLVTDGFNVSAKIEEGTYIPVDVTDALSSFMVNDFPDSVLFRKSAGDLIMRAATGSKDEHRRVVACGEAVHILLAAGNLEGTIKLEQMWDEISESYEVDILCGYFRSAFTNEQDTSMIERVCAQHSAVHGQEPLQVKQPSA